MEPQQFRLNPQSLQVENVNSTEDRETALWEPGSSAFWLDPDRWFGVPNGKNGKMEPFWLHLDKRPPSSIQLDPIEPHKKRSRVPITLTIPYDRRKILHETVNGKAFVGYAPDIFEAMLDHVHPEWRTVRNDKAFLRWLSKQSGNEIWKYVRANAAKIRSFAEVSYVLTKYEIHQRIISGEEHRDRLCGY